MLSDLEDISGCVTGCQTLSIMTTAKLQQFTQRKMDIISLNTQQPIQGIGTQAHWSGQDLAN